MEGLVCGIDKKIPREKQGWRQRRRETFTVRTLCAPRR